MGKIIDLGLLLLNYHELKRGKHTEWDTSFLSRLKKAWLHQETTAAARKHGHRLPTDIGPHEVDVIDLNPPKKVDTS